ncbi:MAG: HAD-IB family hydrolase [Planctomycetes bacterium]|nr:HAD-IB family hydrolase [Planctomycetota bacterium]
MSIAFFDLDHTLLDGDSDSSFLDYLVDKEIVSADIQVEKEAVHRAYMKGAPWQAVYRKLLYRMYRGLPVSRLEDLARKHAHEFVLPMLFAGARGLIEEQAAKGRQLVLLTTTNQMVVTPVAQALGLNHVLSTRLEIKDAHFTGNLEGDTFCTGPAKAVALLAYCKSQGIDPQECAMFGDGRSDLEALDAVGEPVAVHAIPELAQRAQERGWRSITLSRTLNA